MRVLKKLKTYILALCTLYVLHLLAVSRHTDRQTDRHTYIHTSRQTDRHGFLDSFDKNHMTFQHMREGNSGVHETVREAGVQLSSLTTFSPEGNGRDYNTHQENVEATRDNKESRSKGGEVDEGPNPKKVIIIKASPPPPLPSAAEPKTREEFMRDRERVSQSYFVIVSLAKRFI